MTNYPVRLKSKLAALVVGILTLAPSLWSADALITFGSGSPTAGKGKTAGPNATAPTLVETKDSVVLTTPNWWSALVQYEHFTPVSLTKKVQPADSLTLAIKGTASGPSPKLKLLLFTSNWQQKGEWTFDLSALKPDQYTVIKADASFGQVVTAGNGLLTEGVGVIQIATRGNDHLEWSLDIQSIGVATQSAAK
ncbi:MAG: hypothetical protein ACAH89_08600 [Rariglobus sp.]